MAVKGPGVTGNGDLQWRMPVAAEIDQWLRSAFTPELESRGFEQVRRRAWIRSSKRPIREGVIVLSMKGASLVPAWFLSLDFVPHVTSGGQVRRHETAKSALPDLRVDQMDEPDRYDLKNLVVYRMGYPRAVQFAISRSAHECARRAEDWFRRVSDAQSLLPLFEEAQCRPAVRFGFDNYVQQRLALAFVYAYLGQVKRAELELDTWYQRHGPPGEGVLLDLRARLHALSS